MCSVEQKKQKNFFKELTIETTSVVFPQVIFFVLNSRWATCGRNIKQSKLSNLVSWKQKHKQAAGTYPGQAQQQKVLSLCFCAEHVWMWCVRFTGQ